MRALIADIITHASRLSGVSAQDIRGPSRLRHVARVRQAVCLIAREQMRHDEDRKFYAYSYPQIGAVLGDRDHSTIIHGCKAAANIATRDPVFAAFIVELRNAAANGNVFEKGEPAPVKQAPVWVLPDGLAPRLKRTPVARKWEVVELPCANRMRIDEDGWTLDEIQSRELIVAGSHRLAAAINKARAA